MPKLKIKTGDNVQVIAGKDKGKQGKVLAAFPQENKVIVDGVNVAIKHQKPKSAQDKGGKVNVNLKIQVSNVMLVCPVCKKPSRVTYKMVNGEKVRICKKCKKPLDSKVKVEAPKATKTTKVEDAKVEAKAEPKVEKTTATKTATAKKTTTKSTTTKTATTKSTTKVEQGK